MRREKSNIIIEPNSKNSGEIIAPIFRLSAGMENYMKMSATLTNIAEGLSSAVEKFKLGKQSVKPILEEMA